MLDINLKNLLRQSQYIAVLKLLNAVSSFILISLTIEHLGVEKYGIWVTISVFLNWIFIFDFGIGNGMRNELAKCFAKNDLFGAKEIVSTSYVTMSIPIALATVLGMLWITFSNLATFLNFAPDLENEVKVALLIIVAAFGLRLILNLITSVLLANHKSAQSEVIPLFCSVITLILVFISTKFFPLDLIKMAVYALVLPVLFLLILSAYLYHTTYRNIKPSWKSVSREAFPKIAKLGIKFFYIQIGGIFFFSVGIFLLNTWGNQELVAEFNILYKYFSIILIFSTAYAIPMWSITTTAETLSDKRIYRNLMDGSLKLIVSVVCVAFLMILVGPYIFAVWVPQLDSIKVTETVLVGAFVCAQAISHPFAAIINGSGKILLSIISITFRIIIFYPTTLILYNYWSENGIIASMLFMQIIAVSVQVLQVRQLAKTKQTKSIWNQ